MNYAVIEKLDLNPSFLEVRAAEAVFKKRLSHFAADVSRGAMRPETAVACALAEVWRQGRRFQRDQDYAALLALGKNGTLDKLREEAAV